MTTKPVIRLTAAALWTALTTPCLAIPSPQQSSETVAQMASSTPAEDQNESLPRLRETASTAISGPFENPFVVSYEPHRAKVESRLTWSPLPQGRRPRTRPRKQW